MENNALGLLKKSGALITDNHFVLSSGKHSPTYINKDALYPHTEFASKIGELFAEKNKSYDVEVVAAPALGGIILSQWTAFHLSRLLNREVLGIYTEKTKDNDQILTRGYDTYIKNKNVLIIEDLTTTGESVKKVIRSVTKAGGNVAAVSVMVNRNPREVTSESIGAPFSALATLDVMSFEENLCPLCQKGVPINTLVGHGKKFLSPKKF